MTRYINAELIERHINREEHYTPDERWRPESEFAKLIDSIPTADVAEVVRCKDCIYYEDICGYDCFHPKQEQGWNSEGGECLNMNPDDFCSYGKKVE